MTSLPLEDLPPEADCFVDFWSAYPRRVGKLAARKAYSKARKSAGHDEIMRGLLLYLRTKPAYADWCHPTSWLNAGRWMDEPDAKSASPKATPEQILESAAWCIRSGTSSGHRFRVSRENARACVAAGLVTEEQAEPWL